ncbi:MAG: hypothetical protein QMD50_02310 [Patescibacteria group bacterium]|nr:hypothetical protein [Patescibacteria group bacterium]
MPITLKEVPIKIKTHLGSDEIIGVIDRLNNNARIYPASVVPSFLYRLITKIIAPERFYEMILNELHFSEEKTKAITGDIKEKILEPISADLKAWGINIDAINIKNALAFREFLKKEKEELQKFGVSFEIIEEPEPIRKISLDKISEAPVMRKIPIKETENFFSSKENSSPLIIHQIKPLTDSKPKTSSSAFSLPFKFLKSKLSQRSIEKPIIARVEAPEKTVPEPAQKEDLSKRVVHYSNNRTEITPSSEPLDFINLEKLTPLTDNATVKKPEAADKTTESDKNKPKLDGNTVDLR